MEIFKLFGKIAVDNSEANRAIDETVGNVGNAEPRMSKALKKIGAAVVAAFAVDKIKDFGKACISAGMDFDSQMSTVAAISGATGEEFEILRAKAQEMGATTAFSATESAQAMEYMAMAGWKTTDITNGLAGVMNLAAASGEDLATTSDIVTDAMTAFGMSAEESTHFADVLAQTATNANTNVGMMGETFKYVAPVAGSLGYNVEDTAAAIGLMANSGIKASQAGTALRTLMTNMANPTDKMAEAMDTLGISLTDSSGEMKSFAEITEDLRNGFSGLTEEQKASTAANLAGKEGMSGLLAIVNASEEDYKKLTDSIKDCSGASEKMAEIRLDNLEGDVTLFKSALEGAQIAISDKLTPVLRNLVKKATDAIPKIQKKITSIFDSLKKKFIDNKETLSKLKDGIKQFGNAAKDAFEKLFSAAGNALDILFDFLGWLTSGSAGAEAFKTSVMGIVTAYMTFKTITTVIDLTKAAVDRLKNAQMNLNLSNPVGWISLAISAFVTLETRLRSLPSPTEKVIAEFSKLDKAEQELVDRIGELTEEYEAFKESKEKAIADTSNEFDYYHQVSDELQTLVDKNGKVKEGYEGRAEFIVGILNDALGTEIEMTDGVIKNYDELADSIDEVIEKKKAEVMLSANEDAYAEAVQNVAEAQKAYYEQAENVNKTKNEMIPIQSALNDLEHMSAEEIQRAYEAYAEENNISATYGDIKTELTNKLEGLNNQLNTHETALNDAENAYFGYCSTIKNYEGLGEAIANGDMASINEALEKMTKGFLTAETADAKSLERQTSNLKEEVANMKTALKNGMPGVTQEQIDQLENLVNESEKEWQKALGNVTDFTGNVRNELNVDYSAEGSNAMTTWGNGAVSAAEGVITTLSGLRNTFSSLMSGYSVNVSTAEIVASTKKLTGHAKGGIVTREHVARVGEDGAEAIVPLEKNTEWIDKVAAKVTDSMGGAPSNTAILNKLNELIEVIKGQKVYLDSGALVGEIAPAMDGALGNISRMKRRGLR